MMTHHITPDRDYELVKRTLAFINENWRDQPSLETIAEAGRHARRTICSGCSRAGPGLSPKAFLQAVTLDHARELLRDSASILDTAYEVGLSGPGRLHDLFVTHEGMTPGVYKSRERAGHTPWISRLAIRTGLGDDHRPGSCGPGLRR